jgi:stage II sporulation protein R
MILTILIANRLKRLEEHRMKWLYLLFAFAIMMMSWEANRIDAAVVENTIPNESIRLRVIANSDSPEDQWIKSKVRDRVVEQITQWVDELEDLEEAREIIRLNLPELQDIVKNEIQSLGYPYNSGVELGMVPFPTKVYAGQVYPAGEYEALRITIGEGKGENWWCVLFPPLCFVDFTTEEAAQEQGSTSNSADTNSKSDKVEDVEVGFFLWDWFKNLLA